MMLFESSDLVCSVPILIFKKLYTGIAHKAPNLGSLLLLADYPVYNDLIVLDIKEPLNLNVHSLVLTTQIYTVIVEGFLIKTGG